MSDPHPPGDPHLPGDPHPPSPTRTTRLYTPDPRGWPLRIATWLTIAWIAFVGAVCALFGLAGVLSTEGQGLLCFGLVALVGAGGMVAREVVERHVDRHPPQPRLTTLDGEPALLLPRHAGRTWISIGMLLAVGAVGAVATLLIALTGPAAPAVFVGALTAFLLVTAAPHRAEPGGLWATPTRLVHRQDGVGWSAPWDDVRGALGRRRLAVGFVPGRTPRIRRHPYAGWRHRGPARVRAELVVETRYLAGGSTLARHVVNKARFDPGFRAALGTPETLPPAELTAPASRGPA